MPWTSSTRALLKRSEIGSLNHKRTARGGVAIATVLVVPGDDATVAGLRALADGFQGEVGISAWNGFAVARFCAENGARLRHDLVSVLVRAKDGDVLSAQEAIIFANLLLFAGPGE